MSKVKEENFQRATAVVMVTLFLSRILGFVREMIIAKIYGRGIETDAFFAAFTIPDMMFDLLIAGALSSGFMPVFTQFIAKDEEDKAWSAANTFITVGLLFVLLFNLFGITFTKYLVPLVASGMTESPEKFNLTVRLTRVMFSAITFTVMGGFLKGILNSYKLFTAPALGPVLYNIGMILGALLLGKTFGIYGMAIGVIIGAFLNFAVQLPDFSKVGKRFRFKIDMKDEGFRQMMILMVPGIIGLSVSQINYVVNQNIASQLDTGSITALRYAYRVMLLPLGIFAMSLATTIFPKLNTHVSRNEMDEYKKTFSMGIRTVMFITIPSMVGLLVLSSPIIRLLFKTGKFTEADVKVTAFALAFYSFGLLGQSAVQIITRGFYSIKDTKTPLKIGVLTVAINITLNLIFVKSSSLAVGGIALSHSITTFINMYLLYRSLSKKVNGLRTRETVVSCAKSAVSAAAMGVVVYFVSGFMEARFGIESKTAQLLDVGSAIVIGGTVYFLVAYLLRMSEMQYVVDTLKKKFKK